MTDQAQTQPDNTRWREYFSETFRFLIALPADWQEVSPAQSETAFLGPLQNGVAPTLVASVLAPEAGDLTTVRQQKGLSPELQQESVVQGYPAILETFTPFAADQNADIVQQKLLVAVAGTIYCFIFTCANQNIETTLPIFDKMRESLYFVPAPPHTWVSLVRYAAAS